MRFSMSRALVAALALAAAPALAGDDKGAKNDDNKEAKDDDKGEGNAFGADVEGENAKHAMRMAKLARLEQIGKEKSRPELLEKVGRLRARELERHQKALARLAKKGGGKPDDKGKPGGDGELSDKGKHELAKEKFKEKVEEKMKEKKEKKEKAEKKGKGQ